MNKTLFYSLFAIASITFSLQSYSVEARECTHRHSRAGVHVGVGTAYQSREHYVQRRYIRPAPQTVVYADPYAPVYYGAPYAVYAAPAPVYVEEVYVVPARPSLFSGLSFSWNFFR